MAENQYQNASEFQLKKCVISKGDGSQPTSLLSGDMIIAFSFHESVFHPFVGASLMLSDSNGLINTFPIQGGEIVEIEVGTSLSEEPVNYKLKVYKIASRSIKDKRQLYTLVLASDEAFVNEVVRLQTLQEGRPDQIVANLIRKELKSSKEVFVEPTKFEVRMLAARRRPFDLIADLTKKSVSGSAVYTDKIKSNKAKKAYEKNREKNRRTDAEQEIKGTAGYLFWETKRGFNFYSIDALCSVPKKDKEGNVIPGSEDFPAKDLLSEPWGPYEEVVANKDDGKDQRGIVSDFGFSSEVDILTSLRKGKYASLMVFFNISTGQYEEFTYKISQSYDHMSHLGGQESVSLIPTNQEELSETPSRIMSAILDHEAWFNEPEIGDPADAKAENPNKFADWVKYFASQSIARYDLLKTQEATFTIPGNPLICAGDKVDIRIPNKLSDQEKIEQPFDEETSGVYLVKEVSHLYDKLKGGNGNMKTKLKLFRDSYGMKDKETTHGG